MMHSDRPWQLKVVYYRLRLSLQVYEKCTRKSRSRNGEPSDDSLDHMLADKKKSICFRQSEAVEGLRLSFRNTVSCGATAGTGRSGKLSYDYLSGSCCSFEIEKDESGNGIGVFKYKKEGEENITIGNKSKPFPFDDIKVRGTPTNNKGAFVVEVTKRNDLDLTGYFV